MVRATMIVVALCGAVAVGCGGSDDDGVTTSALGKAAFVKRADGVCSSGSQAMVDSLRKISNSPQGMTPVEGLQKVVPGAVRSRAAQIRALGAPEGDAPQVEAYLSALEKVAKEIESQKPSDLFELQELLVRANDAAAAYGLDGCRY